MKAELHYFSDASSIGYGWLVNQDDKVHCALVIGKSRVVPLRPITIRRLELTAAVLPVKMSHFLQHELLCNLNYKADAEIYWTDSKVVLGYIKNDSRRFHVFVANLIGTIRSHTSTAQWHYVKSEDNFADEVSRGSTAKSMLENPRWLNGLEFLWKEEVIYNE